MQHLSLCSRGLVAAAVVLSASLVSAQNLKVALCAAESSNTACSFTDTQTKLMATSRFSKVDIINVLTVTPTLAQLQQYDAVMCWTNSTPLDTNAWGNVLADYVDAGGGVVVTVFANSTTTTNRNIGGRWQSGYLVITDRSGNTTGVGSLGTVAQPGHPLMAGVTAFSTGTAGFRPTGTALQPGCTLIASWSDGKVLVAVGANSQRVDLGFYPASSTCLATYWSGNGDILMANALSYVVQSAAYGTYGTGCAGTSGAPTLGAAAGSRPLPGTTFTASLGNLPLSTAVMLLGFSNTQFGAFPLPYDLALFGLPGCHLRTDPFLSFGVTGANNAATWSLPLPNNSGLLGLVFFNQAFVPDPSATGGFTVTNGGRGRIGI